MSHNKSRELAEIRRHEAKMIALQLFGIAQGGSNGKVERFIDCIINATVLEVIARLQEAERHKATSNNPKQVKDVI